MFKCENHATCFEASKIIIKVYVITSYSIHYTKLYDQEIQDVISGELDKTDNPLKNAPHTAETVTSDCWEHAYTRQQAAFPLRWLKENKYWPPVGRIDDAFGDRNLVCTCSPTESYQ